MTCENCKDVPQNIIDNWRKQQRIQELKQELAQLEKPKSRSMLDPPGAILCSGSSSRYPTCCRTHSDAYYNTAA